MKVTNEQARELLDLSRGDSTEGWESQSEWKDIKLELVKEKLEDTSRWSKIYSRIYKDLNTGKFYHTTFSVGATECQDETPYEYDGDTIEFQEVVPVEKTIITYQAV